LSQDWNLLSSNNELIKFADNSTLLVPENSDISVTAEFTNVQGWAKRNSMAINIRKTKIIFYNPRTIPISTTPSISHIERVTSVKLLQENFSCDVHFKHIITVSSQRLHILKALKHQGLSLELSHWYFMQ